MTSNEPLISLRKGSMSVAVFDGQYGKNVVLQKSYLKKGGDPKNKDDWKRNQINLFVSEIPNVKAVVDELAEKMADEIKASAKKE